MNSILPDLLLLGSLGACCAFLLTFARSRLPEDGETLVEAINRELPQTQCAQCGYPGCRPYAEAIAAGAPVNRCPPGGDDTIAALAALTGREPLPLDESLEQVPVWAIAVIREEACIGCTLCIAACPVDAIIGAQQQMHTVIADLCTGCELCIEPCPVDCIDLVELPVTAPDLGILDNPSANACINCGDCAVACPKDLQPQLLYWYRQDTDRTSALFLESCIECRRCDRVCPSELPLTEVFRASKRLTQLSAERQRQAAEAERRYIARENRLAQAEQTVIARPSSKDRSAILDAIRSGE